MIAIVVSRADSASVHIGEQLLAVGDWASHEDETRPDSAGGGRYYRTDGFELREFDDLHVDLDDPTDAFGADGEKPDFLVFVSRHSGDSGELLTAHVTGNFGPAPYGGEAETLSRAAPGAEKRVVAALASHAPSGYDVGIECTHHGPTDVSVPSLFVELGSDEPQWTDSNAARAVARAVLDLRGTGPALLAAASDEGGIDPQQGETDFRQGETEPRHVVGFGGGHYAPRFTRIVRETAWAVGHVGADWPLGEMGAPDANRNVIEQAFERSRADLAVVEGDRPALKQVIADLGHRVVSETWVRTVGDRPLALVEQLERDLATVDAGLRFGDVTPASASDSDALQICELPAALLSRAQGVDADATRATVESSTVAFETEQAGTRAVGRAAFATDAATPGYADLVAELAAVLERRYDEVKFEYDSIVAADDAAERDSPADAEPTVVVARETAFDPALAAERGVPEGPAFGRLADGDAVEGDGETIEPADVSRTRVDRFSIPTDGATDDGPADDEADDRHA
ncbi:D-aminoacyl-tRNA deacylase [Halorubrum laminariae]|uniref:D-aminoacyl-tRNA deacylase n=1 Tax=Halorubrum laminariae TaxID=1433523 RepID=A0ABD6C671_9EURY|nr:D-aminoacyl-tRNA deacylase [Halorubrum laminariae]